MATTSFGDQLHDLWRTRPARLSAEGKIGGVCAGMAHRYQVDPALVRVAFVVSAFFSGTGIVLYLLAWLLFPQDNDEVSGGESLLGRGRSSQSSGSSLVLVAALAVAVSVFTPIGIAMSGSGMVSLALMLLGWWMLYQRTPVAPPLPPSAIRPPAGTPPPVAPATQRPAPGMFPPPPAAGTAAPWMPPAQAQGPSGMPIAPPPGPRPQVPYRPTDPAAGTVAAERTEPPSWDPLGVAPFAWDLPEPRSAAAPVAPRPRSRIAPLALGLAIIVTGILTAISLGTGADWLTPGRIGAIALAIIGLGLVAGSLRGTGHGLLVVAAPLSVFVILATLLGPVDWSRFQDGAGERNHVVTALTAPVTEFRLGAGELVVDLRQVELERDATVLVSALFAEVVVMLPPDTASRVTCSVRMGEATCPPPGLSRDGPPDDSPILTIDASLLAGSIEVRNE
ncbi:PspC domain-containing protein [Hoyosella sp. G463]|uniref:PspC domain-containing protein n=1 Tax=Lolliginicoccus lacisalsi TaxID=2742202 RepID=A0A927JC98_9ACTN|nr:PspC domain-containing protein [Lolliginicoccus lacisalsi]MBD8506473.1 PspC domain-containing protein [Lolliginicoccus lacisalsi]